jgi:hypothetical protein
MTDEPQEPNAVTSRRKLTTSRWNTTECSVPKSGPRSGCQTNLELKERCEKSDVNQDVSMRVRLIERVDVS